jgi:coproporphyrinogen III oxidase-like Fe-S oxidoreductase
VNFILAWLRGFRHGKELFDAATFPKTLQWLEQMQQTIAYRKSVRAATFTVMRGDEAADVIAALANETFEKVDFDLTEARRLQVQQNSTVAITPEDTGEHYMRFRLWEVPG